MLSKLKRWWFSLWQPVPETESVYHEINRIRQQSDALLLSRRIDLHHMRITTTTETLAQEVARLDEIINHLATSSYVPHILYDVPTESRYLSDWLGTGHPDSIRQLLRSYFLLLTRLYHLSDIRDSQDPNFRAWSFLLERYSHHRMELQTLCQQLQVYRD